MNFSKRIPASGKISFKFVLTIALFSLLFACSSEKVNEPTELEKMRDKVKIERIWKVSVGSGDHELMLSLSPVIKDDFIYTIDAEGVLTVLNRLTGKVEWERELEEQVSGGLEIDSQHLYYATFQGELVCLDRYSGNQVWRRDLTSEAISSPSSNGRIVAVQTIDGKLFAFDASEGIQLWRYDSIGPILSLRGTSSPLVSKTFIITSFSNGEMLAFDNKNGGTYWRAAIGLPQGRTELERLVDADGKVIIDAERVYTASYQGRVVSLDATTGSEIWSKPISSYTGVAVGSSQVYVANDEGVVVAFNAQNSTEVWRNEKLKYRRLSTPTIVKDMVAVSDLEGYLHFLSQSDGEILARKYPDSDGVMGDVLVSGNMVYVYARSGEIVAYRIFN
jgi:outer membrane protein assembly factor BamB